MPEAPVFTTLPDRGLIKVAGPERRAFLQGLVSNDVNLLDSEPGVYACLLTPQGKFLHDFFMTEEGETILLDCEGGARADDLARRLIMYKLRSKVEIEYVPAIMVHVAFYKTLAVAKPRPPMDPALTQNNSYADPRHPHMGYRSFVKPELQKSTFEAWDKNRILLTVPDGSRDMTPEKSTLMESNIDTLNGISFEKGCYVGQELTARMNYRALVKKRLRTVKLNEIPDGAELRSTCGDVGIALVKDES